tara:strand:+ start:33665 stop:33886 length:222 start_codon:yes stop_codon:yes gene_type:complete
MMTDKPIIRSTKKPILRSPSQRLRDHIWHSWCRARDDGQTSLDENDYYESAMSIYHQDAQKRTTGLLRELNER